MNTQSIIIDIPSDIFLALNETETELKQGIKISLAIRLYRLQKLTLGKAAQLADFQDLNLKQSYLKMRFQFQI